MGPPLPEGLGVMPSAYMPPPGPVYAPPGAYAPTPDAGPTLSIAITPSHTPIPKRRGLLPCQDHSTLAEDSSV